LSAEAFLSLLKQRYLDVSVRADESDHGFAEYIISDAGRAALVAQTPEAESEDIGLDTSEATILQALVDGDDLLLDHANHTAWFRVSLATIHESHIKALWDKGLLSVGDPGVAAPDNVLVYTVSAKGRRVLAEQKG
jgi:hypothetical protein